ncbi:phosphatase [Aphanothece hegewaldii CCALA 016]|uniref:Phosphatase n=1 Tax=Aphanothece hegewaldii CCALA 016 TaxID=2107694 RepID=A0A2T1LXJ2_9CHRO|nr:alkaline phosphatase PhoX [Aphanothece hegewaldii]PSF37104.1 phosphatase [Aphanothece hegewaldii CCALA 016]
MNLKRRHFLMFIGATVGGTLLRLNEKTFSMPFSKIVAKKNSELSFQPIKTPIPLEIDSYTKEQQIATYSTYEVVDDLVLPKDFTYDIIAAWGDPVGDSRFGYNNDYLSFIETKPNEGYLTINFEYISGQTWMKTYEKVIGKTLPFTEVKSTLAANQGEINAFALSDSDPLKTKIKEISKEGLIDLGIGIISIRRNKDGKWERTFSDRDRRITGISGLEDQRYLKSTGPSVAVFTKSNKLGYEDQLGSKIIGTFQNCAGGTTPWGTVFSAEENFQDQVYDPVMADGTSFNPSAKPFFINDVEIDGRGNVFGLASNKYGWMVEVDPANPNDYGTKHTWLGRYRHEAVGFRVEKGKPLAVYSGCDRRGGHLYKFVSKDFIRNPKDKQNSQLLERGMLYGARFNPDGTGKWLPLTLNTPVDPVLPSQIVERQKVGIVALPNPNRTEGGIVAYTKDEDIAFYKQKFKTLSDLYEGNPAEKQGAILIDAHYAANAAGITCTARPEDTEVSPDGTLYITFTSGTPGEDGGPDKNIFFGTKGETPYEYGWIMSLKEDQNDPSAMSFRWRMFATGGEPTQGGLGFSNPDNLEFDASGHLWMVCDMSTTSHNDPKKTLGIFGNNTAWFLPTSGPNMGNAYPFAIGPMDTELTGPWFTKDQQTLFLSVQHPGEAGGTRQDMAFEEREFTLNTTQRQEFMQQRKVPIGSNWPSKQANDPPRPAVVAIRRVDNQGISRV